jgi:hypothetical protein
MGLTCYFNPRNNLKELIRNPSLYLERGLVPGASPTIKTLGPSSRV